MSRKNTSGPTWITREGDKIPIAKMENSHLVNTIHYLERYAARIKTSTAALKDTPLEIVASQLVPQFMDLVKELAQRIEAKNTTQIEFIDLTPLMEAALILPSVSKKARRGLVKIKESSEFTRPKITRRIILRE